MIRQIQLNSSKKSLIPVIAASTVGTLIEWYDFYIFGSLATIISTKFFPKENATAAFLATLATFAAGLLIRPFGALFFGRLGDLIGRKHTFMVTLVLMGGSTFAIGLVPAYETIGFWAPLSVLILRLLGLAAFYVAIFKLGISKIMSGNQDDLIFGIIVMVIISPIVATGLFLFGKYALQGEYNE